MNIAVLTNEYPPYVYGGAGVHVEYLTRELAALDGRRHTVRVLCFGDQREHDGNLQVQGIRPAIELPAQDPRHSKLFATLLQDLVMAGTLAGVDIVHCHTWYTHLGGCLGKQLQRIPLVLTTHSLEPHRPWKAEQLGTAYAASSWIERVAYQAADGVVAVSEAMKRDVHDEYAVAPDRIRVIHNGIDLQQYRPTRDPAVLRALHIDPDVPFVLFVGRITRQKGIVHLVNAIKHFHAGIQVVLCAGAPDTPELAAEIQARIEELQRARAGVVWIEQMLPKTEVIQLLSRATVFVCPSIYEPLGIVNLEAMACETAVVATATGGIPEVVEDEVTGLLVPFDPVDDPSRTPRDPERFARDIADRVNRLVDDPAEARRFGLAGRERAVSEFGWSAVAERVHALYRTLL